MASPSATAGPESRLARAWRRIGQLIEHGGYRFFADGCTQRAAAISFYALFSIFPLAILSVAVLGLVANDADVRREVVDFMLDRLPLTPDKGRADLETAMLQVTSNVAGLSVLGILTLLIAASNVMGSIRQALNAAFGVHDDRPPAQAKLWDLFMVLIFGVLVTISLALTLIDGLVDKAPGPVTSALTSFGRVLPLLITVVVFLGVFRFVPAKRSRVRDIWPGVLVAAMGYELAKAAFTAFLSNFAGYDPVYASLGSVIAFLVFTYVTAFVALLGAEFAAEWPCVRDGEYDGPPGPPFHHQLAGWIKSLFVRT